MTKWLLKIETVLTVPFFIASWLVCSVAIAVRGGYRLAVVYPDQKRDVLDGIAGKQDAAE